MLRRLPKARLQTSGAWLFALFAAVVSGCSSSPEAPELSDAPVYQNKQEGFRFLVPDGWTQTASSVLPEGDLEGETFLVRYRVKSPEAGSTLQVLCFQDKNGADDLEEHHAGPSFRVEKWSLKQPAEEATINETKAQRIVYTAKMDKRELTKQVVCFRKADRVYSFVGLYSSTDEKARQQIERAVNSVIWKG